MHIVSLQKTSLLDYPDKISCIVFTAWCNFRCGFCHNPECVLPDMISNFPKLNLDNFFIWLEKKKWLIDWVSICWWEPTLQSDLIQFIQKIKNLWFLVKLDTNGRDSFVLEYMISKNLLDYVAIDAKFPLNKLNQITNTDIDKKFIENYKKCIFLLKSSNIDYEYRTTVFKNYHNKEIIKEICKELWDIKKYYIQNFKFTKTIDPDFNWSSFSDYEVFDLLKVAQKYIKKSYLRM